MARYLKVFPDKKPGKKDGWNWNCSEPARGRIKSGPPNVLYSAQGYNSRGIALRQARRHNRTLRIPLNIKVFSAPNIMEKMIFANDAT